MVDRGGRASRVGARRLASEATEVGTSVSSRRGSGTTVGDSNNARDVRSVAGDRRVGEGECLGGCAVVELQASGVAPKVTTIGSRRVSRASTKVEAGQ